MLSQHPWDEWIEPFELPMRLDIGMLYPLITRDYVSSKLMLDLCLNPCATSPHFISHHLHFDPTRKMLRSVGIIYKITSHFLSEHNSTSIASFNLIQSEHLMHSAMDLGSVLGWRSFQSLSWTSIVVFMLNDDGNFIYPFVALHDFPKD
jgi:hypothetical protein